MSLQFIKQKKHKPKRPQYASYSLAVKLPILGAWKSFKTPAREKEYEALQFPDFFQKIGFKHPFWGLPIYPLSAIS